MKTASQKKQSRTKLNTRAEKATLSSQASTFIQLQKIYGTTSPQQIQMRILFVNLMSLIRMIAADDQHTKATMNQYHKQWLICEAQMKKLNQKH
jgi:hypothetical protein